jgi:hypothetical protein
LQGLGLHPHPIAVQVVTPLAVDHVHEPVGLGAVLTVDGPRWAPACHRKPIHTGHIERQLRSVRVKHLCCVTVWLHEDEAHLVALHAHHGQDPGLELSSIQPPNRHTSRASGPPRSSCTTSLFWS